MTPDDVVAQSSGKAEHFVGKRSAARASLVRGSFETKGTTFDVFFHFGIERQDLVLVELLVKEPTFSRCNTLRTSMLDVYGPPEQAGGVAIIKLSTFQWRDQSSANRVLLATSEAPTMCSIQYTPLTSKASLGL